MLAIGTRVYTKRSKNKDDWQLGDIANIRVDSYGEPIITVYYLQEDNLKFGIFSFTELERY